MCTWNLVGIFCTHAHRPTQTHTHTLSLSLSLSLTHTHTRSVDSLSFTAALSRLYTLVIYYEVVKATSYNSCARALGTFFSPSYSFCLSSRSYTHRFSPRFCDKNSKRFLLFVPEFVTIILTVFVVFCFSLLFCIFLSVFQKQSRMARGAPCFFFPRMARGENK